MKTYRLIVKANSPRSARRYAIMRCPGAQVIDVLMVRANEFSVKLRAQFNESYALARWEHENRFTATSTGLPFGALLLWNETTPPQAAVGR